MVESQSVIIKPSLEEMFRSTWDHCRIFLFSAPCGCGKTTTAKALLRGKNVCILNAADADFSSKQFSSKCDAVLLDDLQYLLELERQLALCELIRSRPDLHFVLLGRGRVPGWLMPFQFAGIMQTIETEGLLFDRESSRRMLESRGIVVDPMLMTTIHRDMGGYPLTLELLCRRLARGETYSENLYNACKRDLFVYYGEAVFRRFEPSLRHLLLCLAPFDSFHLELAKMVSGNPHAGELLGILQRDTTMLLFDGLEVYRFRPIFRAFLLWALHQTMTDADQKSIYSRAALCYELRGELNNALQCYALSGEQNKISILLVKNAEQHPGLGYYRELQDYYFALPREEILRSPALICGMSMLTALCLDYESSEQWYRELQQYAARLKRSDSEFREVRGRLTYLDIGLPQRGSKSLIHVIDKVFHAMMDKEANVPPFSVTSMLPSVMNGGKDFCEWSKKDDLLYATMRRPVEAVLGRDGVGLADCGICESKFEKGENVSEQMLTLMARLGEIQARGTPDIEFAVMGLLARIQISQGKATTALESIKSLREKYQTSGETRFLSNLEAMICRIRLRLGDEEAVHTWLEKDAPKNDARLWAMWRYQYLTRVMAQLAEGEADEPLLLLARLIPYCETCGRIMDRLHIHILTALCRERQRSLLWEEELCSALDLSLTYRFLWPVAQYGAAILPLLRECSWSKDPSFLEKLIAATQVQAVFFPHFLKPRLQLAEALSPAETQVLHLLCKNLTNQEIGEILDIKLATVKSHVSHILQKLGVANRTEAKVAAEKLHLL